MAATTGSPGAEAFARALDKLEGATSAPVLSASFDLRPDGNGTPVAPRILREALRTADDGSLRLDTESLAEGLGATLREAASAGLPGLFVAGPLDDPVRLVSLVPIPPRNHLSVGEAPSRFELERYRALTRIPVAVAWADRSRVAWTLVRGDAEPIEGHLDADPHFMRGSLGRTGQHDRGGPVGSPSGGHSKTRIEESAEEARDHFARDVAERLVPDVRPAEIVIVHGPEEFRARLIAELPQQIRDRIEAADEPEREPTGDDLVTEARERAVGAQFDRAAREAEAIMTGALGERAALDASAIGEASTQGRLEQLILHEEAVSHFGTALDARRHETDHDEALIEGLLREALSQSATCWFAHADQLDSAPDGAIGSLRW